MKKIVFVLSLVIANFTAPAQTIIPFIGGNLSGYHMKQGNWASRAVPGLNLGVVSDIRISHLFSLQPGLQYEMTGSKVIYTYPLMFAWPQLNYRFRIHSVQLPVMMALKIDDKNHGHFFATAGVYATANFAGTLDGEGLVYDPVGHATVQAYKIGLQFDESKQLNIRRYDFGLSLGAGYHMTVGPELYLCYQKGTEDMLSRGALRGATTYQLGIAARYAIKWSPKHANSKKYVNHK